MTEYNASKNTLLTIILVLLILITGAMIFNFYGMRIQSDTNNIPKCVGADGLNLKVVDKSNSNNSSDGSSQSHPNRVGRLLREKVGDYSDGSYNPELQAEMIKRAQEAMRAKVQEAQDNAAQAQEAKTQDVQPKVESKPMSGSEICRGDLARPVKPKMERANFSSTPCRASGNFNEL